MRRLFTLFIIFAGAFIIILSWWQSSLGKASDDSSKKVFVIPKGAGVSEIADKLKSEGLIKSGLAFKIYVRKNNLTNKLQAGSFKLSPSMTVQEIVKTLQLGSEDIWVTLIEGWRLEEMARELSAKFQIPST